MLSKLNLTQWLSRCLLKEFEFDRFTTDLQIIKFYSTESKAEEAVKEEVKEEIKKEEAKPESVIIEELKKNESALKVKIESLELAVKESQQRNNDLKGKLAQMIDEVEIVRKKGQRGIYD